MIPRRALVQFQKIGELGIVKCSGDVFPVLSGHQIICWEVDNIATYNLHIKYCFNIASAVQVTSESLLAA